MMDNKCNFTIIHDWPRWMSLKVAAAYTSFSSRQIERFVLNGDLSFTRIRNGHKRLDRLEIDRLFEKNKVNLQSVIGKVFSK